MSRYHKNEEIKKSGLYVEVRGNDVTRALRRLKKLVNAEGIIKDMRKKEFYEKPTSKRKRKKAEAKARTKREMRMSATFQPRRKY